MSAHAPHGIGLEKPRVADGPSSELASEVTHEIRNQFHRVYHWLDLIDRASLGEEGRRALGAAEEALTAIESLATRAMALARPLDLCPIRVGSDEVVENAARLLRQLGATDVETQAPPAEMGQLALDASHFSSGIEVIGRRLWGQGPMEGRVLVRGALDEAGAFLLTVHVSGVDDPPAARVDDLVEWEHARRMIAHSGGELVYEQCSSGERRVLVLLPIET